MAKIKVLIVESIEDNITHRRHELIATSKLIKEFTLDYCYALAGSELLGGVEGYLSEEVLLQRMDDAVRSFKPDCVMIHSGMAYHRFPKAYKDAIPKLKKMYPSLSVGLQNRAWSTDESTIFDVNPLVKRVQSVIFEKVLGGSRRNPRAFKRSQMSLHVAGSTLPNHEILSQPSQAKSNPSTSLLKQSSRQMMKTSTKTPRKPRYVKTVVPLAHSQVEIYAGAKVARALEEIQDLDLYKGAKVIELVEAAYEQGKKDGARSVREAFDKIVSTIPHQNPGRPKLPRIKKRKGK